MSPFISEFLGTMVLLTLGTSVVASQVLSHTKSSKGDWLTICLGWALAVLMAVLLAAPHSGAHLNPAFSLAMYLLGNISGCQMVQYIGAQLLGAMAGSALTYSLFYLHFQNTPLPGTRCSVFFTNPAISHPAYNLWAEIAGTFLLIFLILVFSAQSTLVASMPWLVSLIVLSIGLSIGSLTGFALNPARDLGPRIFYAIVAQKDFTRGDYEYMWIPVLGPLAGALLAVGAYSLLF